MADGAATTITLATATPGGGFPLYGGVVAETLNAFDPSLQIETRNTKGSTENVPLLEAGTVDLGLVQGEVAYEAFAGIGRAQTAIKIVAAMYSTAGMFVVRADSPFRSITDLKGSAVAFGARGSGLVVLARYVLDGLGLDPDRDFGAVYLDHAEDGPRLVLDKQVAALWGGGTGWPGFMKVAGSRCGARFITPNGEEAGRILAKHSFLKNLSVEGGIYPGQDAPLASVGSWSFIMARPDLPEEIGYRLAHNLHKCEPALAERLPQAEETMAVNTVAAAPDASLIHPGAARYLRDIGELA